MPSAGPKNNRFVVQRHGARTLRYDLRLQRDDARRDVLLSVA